jgi:endonuclease/exonuclease/phosphatase family metal-dependent hydrolase
MHPTSGRVVAIFLTIFFAGCPGNLEIPKSTEKPTNSQPTSKSAKVIALAKAARPRLENPSGSVRFSTFNISFHRQAEGELATELAQTGSEQPARIAEIIQRVRPDVILLNEFDYDPHSAGLINFQKNYLAKSQAGLEPIEYSFSFSAPVNTGYDSGLDLNSDGQLGTPEDAFGYGAYPGQYGMAVLSKFPIETQSVRTFRNFLWKDMPDAAWPIDPATKESYYSDEVTQVFRLSSKSHWDVPIRFNGRRIHFLVSHPTPPVFDGPEDRNGCRNHDEIRFWADYLSDQDYIYDDQQNRGGLAPSASFVIAGDLNADPIDGDSRDRAIRQLLNHPGINPEIIPRSQGGVYHSSETADANAGHQGDPAHDTAHFNPNTGNLRVDYCLASRDLEAKGAGIYWPMPQEVGGDNILASDHRLVWVDLLLHSAPHEPGVD